MAIVQKNHVSKSAIGASLASMTNPASTANGDFLLAHINAPGATTSTAPDANWIKVRDDTSGGTYHAVYRRFATSATDGQGTWAATGAKSVTATVYGMTGPNTSTPVRVSTVARAANSITAAPASLTGLTAGDDGFVFNATNAGPQPWADPGAGCVFGTQPSGSFGHWIKQSSVGTFETVAGRPLGHGHSFAPWDMSTFPALSTGTGPNIDFQQNRLSVISWFADYSYIHPNDYSPLTLLTEFNSGNYDSIILGNGQAMRSFKHPLVFRLFCELNGGDHPWEVAYTQYSGIGTMNVASWVTQFLAAWKRIWAITKGSDADVATFAPGYSLNSGHSAGAQNAFFHWCPQTSESSTTSRDKMYPGDKFVDMAGSEMYLSGSNTTAAAVITDTTTGRATHVAADAYYAPGVNSTTPGWNAGDTGSAGGLPCGNGEGGPRLTTSDTDASATTKINSFLTGIKAHPGWNLYSHWDGGSYASGNNSTVETFTAAQKTAFGNFASDPHMQPILDRTFASPPTGAGAWTELKQFRAQLGGNDVNTGANMSGTQVYHKAATGASLAPPAVTGFGYGDWSSISVAVASSGGGSVAPNGGTVTINNLNPNYDGVTPTVLTATPSGWSGTPAIVGGDYSYQWVRVGGGLSISTAPKLVYDFTGTDLTSTTAVDTSGNSNNGTLHGFTGVPPTVSGPTSIDGTGVVFDSIRSQYIEAPDSNSLDTGTVWTIDAWIKPTLTGGVGDRWAAVSKGHCWELQVRTGTGSDGAANANHVRIGCFFGGDLIANWVTVDSPAAIPANTWTHIAGRYDGAHVALFVDGVNVNQVAETRTPNTNTEAFHIGMHQQVGNNPEGPTNYFDGAILLPHVYASALSDADIATISAGFAPNMVFGFENVTGPTITDDSGNNVVAVAQNMATPVLVSSASGHGSALQFDFARSQFLLIDNTSGAYDFPHWTIAAWVYFDPSKGPTNTGGGLRWEIMEHSQSFWANIRGDTTPNYLIRIGGFFGGSLSTTEYDSNTPIVPNTWTHIAGTYDGANIRWYINGSLDKTQAQTGGTNPSTANPLAIGSKHRVSPSLLEQAYFNGAFDQFVLTPQVLSATNIGRLMNIPIDTGSRSNVGINSSTYTVVLGDVGDQIEVDLIVNNGVAPNGTASDITNIVTNVSGQPVNTGLPTVPASPTVGVAQTGTQGTWTGAASFAYQWLRINPDNSTTVLSGNGATTLTYTPQIADLSGRLELKVTAYAGAGQSGLNTAATSLPSSAVASASPAYPNPPGTNYNEFAGLPSTAVDTYTSFDGVVVVGDVPTTEENRASRAMVQIGNTDYWGGSFTLATSPGGSAVTRTNLAAVNATTGALLAFAPTLDGTVRGLAVSPDSQFLYVVGDFTHVNGTAQNRCARFKVSDGTLDATWAPSANGSVRGVVVSPDGATVYLSGTFTTINGTSRVLVAATNASNGTLTSFAPAVSDSLGSAQVEVRKIRFAPGDSTHLYIAGYFDTITVGVTTSTRLAVARLNLDGSVDAWHPDTAGTTTTTIGHDICFKSDGSECYVAFAGSDVGGDGNNLIAYVLSPLSNTRKWAAVLDGDVNSCDTNDIYVWGGTHGDGTQNLSTISNVGSRKIVCVRTSDGTGGTNGLGQKTSLWTPGSQFNGIKGTYIIVCAADGLKLGGGWSTPNQSAASFSATSLQEFTVGVDGLSGAVLTPGQAATVTVNFSPAVLGPRTATLTINDNSGGSPTSQNVVLNGNGVTTAPAIATVPASSMDFGSVQLSNKSTSATFAFTDPTPGVTFLAHLDSNPYVTVTSPITYSGLSIGTHTFFVIARNGAGDSSPATYTWTISP